MESFSDQIEEMLCPIVRAKRINQVYQDLIGCTNGLRSIAKALNIPEILYADDQPLDPVLNAILEEIKILKNKLQNGIKGE